MGFSDKIAGILNNLPLNDPLFGGLIPRRDETRLSGLDRERIERTSPEANLTNNTTSSRNRVPIRRTGMDKVTDSFLNQNRQDAGQSGQSDRPGKVVFDWSEQELNLKRRALDLEREKFGYERNKDEKEFGLKGREQNRKELEDENRLDLDHRKHALDEWKTKNPEGEIKTDETGRLMIIDKRTGKSIDTGLKTDHLSEEKKLELQAKNAQELEGIRQKNRLALEAAKPGKNINPSQQRTAERDAFNEVMNSGKYKDIQDYVEVAEDGSIVINKPGDKDIKNWFTFQSLGQQHNNINNINKRIAEFEKEWKGKSEERMNKIFNTGSDDMVDMTDPNGAPLRVPKNGVEKLKSFGAKVVGEETDTKPKPMPKVADDIEMMYNDKGDIIGARNRKPAGSSK